MSAFRRAVAVALLSLVSFAPALAEVPSYGPRTLELTERALEAYRALAANPDLARPLPRGTLNLAEGRRGGAVSALRARLAAFGDLETAAGDIFDAATTAALRRFQARHGLTQTGAVGRMTLGALDMPMDQRIARLSASVERMRISNIRFADRYVVVNIPAATTEAIAAGVVERRHTAIVGRADRPSPVLAARLTAVNLNPTWTVPASITRSDIAPQAARDPAWLARHGMRVIGPQGVEYDPATMDWTRDLPHGFVVRQDPGPDNSLGAVRIDMPNAHAVFLHDTPKRELFRSDRRFHSSGCARVDGVRDLAAWLLDGSDWTRERIEQEIGTGARVDIRLHRPVPVLWVYLTAWAMPDGTVHFREDVYEKDNPLGILETSISPNRALPRPAPQPAAPIAAVSVDPTPTGSIRPRR
jgi:murein L,D-transpeptidase YcbB/YkuD